MMDVRDAEAHEIDSLARLWNDTWHEVHGPATPAPLRRLRTLDSFRERLRRAFPEIRVVGPSGRPVGFCLVRGDELYQLHVSAAARGSGAGGALTDDAEARIAAGGARTAWLACATDNGRAARFYEERGWRRTGTMTIDVDTSAGPYPFEVWRYEKSLGG